MSYATDLGPVDPGPSFDDDIYVRDLETGVTTLATVSVTGKEDSGDGKVRRMALSADGTKLVFTSSGRNLVPVDTNAASDVFARDLVTGTTTLVSVNAAGTDSANGGAGNFALSPDGTRVAFTSSATDLGPPTRGDRTRSDVYLRDLTTGRTTLLSALPSGLDGFEPSRDPAFSPLGDAVAFSSQDGLGLDTDGQTDVFLYDLATNTNTLISTAAPAPAPAQTVSFNADAPVFAPSGRAVAYEVDAVYAVGTNQYRYHDVDVADRDTGQVELVSMHPVPTVIELNGDRSAHTPVFSPDSTQVVFESGASYFGPTDTNHDSSYLRYDLYLRNLATDTTSLISVNTDGSDAMGGSDANFSPDGELIAFGGLATFVPERVYLREPSANRTTMLKIGAAQPGIGGNWKEANPTFLAGDSTRLAFVSENSDLGPTDTNGDTDVYVATGVRPSQ